MARQHTISRQIQRFAVTVPAFAGIAMLSGPQQQSATPLCLLVGAAEKYAIRLLVDMVPAVFQALQGCDSHWSSLSAGHLIETGCHILRLVCGAA
jgi:hypothetical protein